MSKEEIKKDITKCLNRVQNSFKQVKDKKISLSKAQQIYLKSLFVYVLENTEFTSKDLKLFVKAYPNKFWYYLDMLKAMPNLVEELRTSGFMQVAINLSSLIKIEKIKTTI